ncbi:NAD(P)/FAD-dependent oxidoreductase [Rubripirellula reticaptiva]|uniref:Glycine oxidase n=1 Tax=Rubripirellula reticaptiva TaxID=2528013 RepID=A0A5C6FAQ4_9BACT|nr:FAD-dependent oxidoreductase [Rubripirellula reticaptiva]TWU57444.1 Glycine oxidase [Rubripirellula reticaptiva]
MTQHILIVGGGAVGLSIAWELANRGLRVTVIDRDKLGRGTSWAAAGILPPANFDSATDPIDQLRGLSHRLFPDWIAKLNNISSIDIGFHRCGGWYLADTPGERAAMVGMTGYWDELGIVCESVDVNEVARREPAIRDWVGRVDATGKQMASAWWVPDEYQIRTPRFLQALAVACRSAGVSVIEDAPVDKIRMSPVNAVLASPPAVRSGDHWFEADAVVMCGGTWTGQIADALQLQQSIVPIRGQVLLLKTDKPLVRSVVNVGHRYVMCRDDGATLVGSCEEEVGFQLGTDEAMLDSLSDFAVSLIPELKSADRLAQWSGLRPLTFDGFPMIGRVPDTTNVYVAAGHFRSGIHLSPGTAVVIADLITGKEPAINLDAFRVGKQQTQPN